MELLVYTLRAVSVVTSHPFASQLEVFHGINGIYILMAFGSVLRAKSGNHEKLNTELELFELFAPISKEAGMLKFS